ncbi:uncharacterized protein LOC135847984 isoform X2 [Planococcus citri]|uniref:uncharacterized protein LOC135847984 isoform X2 n=1 Tax=Planococcus citri TaxID=170843 RepID=UPI0031F74EF8
MEIYLLFQIFVFLFSIGYRICQPVSKAPVEVIIEEAPKPPVPLLDQCLTQIKESPDTDVTKLSQYKLGLLHGCMNSKFADGGPKSEIPKKQRGHEKILSTPRRCGFT